MSIFDRIVKLLKPHVDAGVMDAALSAAIAELGDLIHDEVVKTVNKAVGAKATPPAPKPPGK